MDLAATETSPTNAAEPASPTTQAAPRASLYRVVWRWHFYAGLFVTPVLLVVTVTGALYIFRSEIEDAAQARLRFVEPGPVRIGAQAQVEAARGACPGLEPTALELSSDPRRASIVRFGPGPGGDAATAYVDPYRGHAMGVTRPGDGEGVAAFFDAVLKLHRELFLGPIGRVVVELTVGWTVLLLATGLYLWWPRGKGLGPGVWWPRLRRAKPYVVLRDLHTVAGFYLLAPIAVIFCTGLFYCLVWGEAFYFATRGETSPLPAAEQASGGEGDRQGPPPESSLSLDRLEQSARGLYPDRNLFITLPSSKDRLAKVGAANDYNRPFGPYVSAQLEIDRVDGRVVAQKTLAEDERYWWHGWVYPLHVGSVIGMTSKILWLVACLILAGLPLTGLWMWWVRRPSGRTGFPRRPEGRLGYAVIAIIVACAILLPVVGASIVMIMAGELIYRLARGSLGGGRRGATDA